MQVLIDTDSAPTTIRGRVKAALGRVGRHREPNTSANTGAEVGPALRPGDAAFFQRAVGRLRELKVVVSPASTVPMSDLTDEELATRIRLVERELAEFDPDESATDVARQFAMLEYLVANPDASLPPLWSGGTVGLVDDHVPDAHGEAS